MVGLHPPSLIFDASTLINLDATGRIREIALALPHALYVSRYVAEHETLYVRVREPGGGMSSQQIELAPLIADEILRLAEVRGAAEASTLIDLATELDDGEAHTAAIAINRGFMVATDDRKARRLLTEEWPSVRILSTTQILKIWSESARVTSQELRDTFTAINVGAKFVPGPHDPLFDWWRQLMWE